MLAAIAGLLISMCRAADTEPAPPPTPEPTVVVTEGNDDEREVDFRVTVRPPRSVKISVTLRGILSASFVYDGAADAGRRADKAVWEADAGGPVPVGTEVTLKVENRDRGGSLICEIFVDGELARVGTATFADDCEAWIVI